ncbi:response regulator [Glycocaulis abyssi]
MDRTTLIRVFIVDDHSLVREALARSVTLEPDIEVCGEARDGVSALEQLAELDPDLVLLDFTLPDMTGLEVVSAMNRAGRRPPVLLLTGAPLDETERAALADAVEGFVHKEDERDTLIAAVRETAARQVRKKAATPREDPPAAAMNAGNLTARERAVLREIARGHSIEQIAGSLAISAATARKHRENIMGKLGVRSTAALVRAAVQIGWY